jgi:hypothetical protein
MMLMTLMLMMISIQTSTPPLMLFEKLSSRTAILVVICLLMGWDLVVIKTPDHRNPSNITNQS